MNRQIVVEERSQVAQARREAVSLATRLGFAPTVTDRLGLAVTATATTLLQHSAGGTVLIAPLPLQRSVASRSSQSIAGPAWRTLR